MHLLKTLILIAFSVSWVYAQEFTMSKSMVFDILTEEYETCETNALDALKSKAIEDYIGCEKDHSKYDVQVSVLSINDRGVTQDRCYLDATLEVNSTYLDAHDYFLGTMGVICQDIDTSLVESDKAWNSFEVGMFVGMSGAQEAIEMSSSGYKTTLEYDSSLMVGIVGNYNHKIFNSQFLGAKAFVAKGFESYTDGDSATPTNDGTPSILRVGGGIYYGYRYHLKTDVSLGANYLMDSLSRTYTNTTYKATAHRVNVELGFGYLILPYLKLRGSVASDMSADIGVSWVL